MLKRILFIACNFISLFLCAQSITPADVASPKPSILINSANCPIGNTIYSCMPKTCTAMTIMEGDSIEFCTNNEIYLNTDSAYWMQWNFTGSTYTSAVNDSFPSGTPICYYPKWNVAGTYTVDIYYNGWLSAYPTSDCWNYGPSHWIITVDVMANVGIAAEENVVACEIFPNPSNGIFQLKISHPENITALYVTDIFGKEIFIAQNKTEIDLANAAAGIYFLHLQTANGEIVKKIIRG